MRSLVILLSAVPLWGGAPLSESAEHRQLRTEEAEMFLLLAKPEPRREDLVTAAQMGFRASGKEDADASSLFSALDALDKKGAIKVDDPRLKHLSLVIRMAAVDGAVDESDGDALLGAAGALLAGYDGTPAITVSATTLATGKKAAGYKGQPTVNLGERKRVRTHLAIFKYPSKREIVIADDVADDIVFFEAKKVAWEQALDVFLERRGLTRTTTATEIRISSAKPKPAR